MKKIIAISLIYIGVLTGGIFIGNSMEPVIQQNLGETINTLDQWKSDGTNITQRTASKPIKITGLESLGCLGTDGSGIIGAGSCTGGAGGGLSTTSPWTVGNLAMVSSNGAVTSIATSTLFNWYTPWTSYGVSTSTIFGFTGGLFSTASSTFSSALRLTSLSQGYLYIGSTGLVNTVASSSVSVGTATALAANGGNCSSGQAPLGVDTLGAVESCFDVWTEAENTSAAYTPQSRTLTMTGTANQITLSTGAQDLSANRTWIYSFPNQVIFPQYASTTLGFSTPYASSTNLFLGTGQGSLYVGSGQAVRVVATSTPTVTSPITYSGTLGSFVGGVAGAFACATCEVGLTAGDNLTRTANDFDLDASLIGLTGIVSTGLLDFGGGVLEIPNGTGPTADDVGELAHDTTDNQLILDDFVVAKSVNTIWKVTVASTSPAFIGGSLLAFPAQLDGYTITAIRCYVSGGTSKVVAVEDASANSTEDITCATTLTSDDGSITNATFTAGELGNIDFGATTGTVDYVTISVFGTWTRE